ncbi:hypothetical protein EGM51_04500 [Verrucomicrobia bacterium S94]|nr:hypothetical protein EGM51_04500 [Verrucomicrobia bacterium S94]
MKWINLCFALLLNAGCAFANPAETKYTVRVLDAETGLPVTNATVQTTFLQKRDPWGTGKGKENRVKKTVDENGEAVLSGRTIQKGEGATAFAEGYYSDIESFRFTGKNLALNRWEPWNPTIEIKMRPKKNPVPMVYKEILRQKVPVKQGRVGFDLEISDWVEPYGNGKSSDFIFTLETVTEPKQGIKYILSFSNPYDGIQEYLPPDNLRSEYIFPYEAPTNGYNISLSKYRFLYYPVIPNEPANNLKEDINYIFRVRTKVDEEGNVTSACYGRIKKEVVFSDTPLMDLQYWFNPDPQSRSLESLKKPY